MNNEIVFIIGPDGVGKTTQINLLINYLNGIGLNYEYKWLRFNHFVSLPLLALARLFGLSEKKTLPSGSRIGYHYFYKSNLISRLYTVTLMVDVIISIFTKYYIPVKVLKKKIVYDRFLYDTLVDLMISTGNHNLYKSGIGNFFLKLIPNNGLTIMLISDEEELRKRRDDVEQDKCLKLKIKLYKKIAKKFNILTLNATLPKDEVHQNILKILINNENN